MRNIYKLQFFALSVLILFPWIVYAQVDDWSSSFDDDLSSQSDIFTDFQEDLGSKEVQEDERFYRHGRFVSTSFGMGLTTFSGNRGKAYHDQHPTLTMGFVYFSDFQSAFGIGLEYSKHFMYLDNETIDTGGDKYGAIEVTFMRPYLAYRYYLDTSDLSSLLTYANPYFIGRIEYWYMNRKFKEYDGTSDSSGSVGASLGAGIEIPIDLKKNFIGLQFLAHKVTLRDTDNGQFDLGNNCTAGEKCYGYSNLKGMGYSIITSYLFSW